MSLYGLYLSKPSTDAISNLLMETKHMEDVHEGFLVNFFFLFFSVKNVKIAKLKTCKIKTCMFTTFYFAQCLTVYYSIVM